MSTCDRLHTQLVHDRRLRVFEQLRFARRARSRVCKKLLCVPYIRAYVAGGGGGLYMTIGSPDSEEEAFILLGRRTTIGRVCVCRPQNK